MMYGDIKSALSGAGIDVRYPGAKQGICTAPYVVVQMSGTYPYAESNRLGYTLITVHCYAPLPDYSALDELVVRVRAALRPLSPDLRPTGYQTMNTINDRFQAHESSVEYMVQRRIF